MKKRWTIKELEKEVCKLADDAMRERNTRCGSVCLGSKNTSCTASLEKEHFTEPQPIVCKYCGSVQTMKYGVRNGEQNYICRICGRKFTVKDTPFYMQTPVEQIGAGLNMYYDGMSLSAIARHLEENYHHSVDPSTVYRWLIRYTNKAINILEPLKPKVSDTWVVDETMLEVGGDKVWFWDVIDEKTRFLIASHLSKNRTILDVATVMRRAWQRTDKAPRFIISDGMPAYPDGIERVFGADSKNIRAYGFTEDVNANLIERFHSTLKARTKTFRGLKTIDSAELILDGFLCYYNFFRPHMSLNDKTPAEVAGIKAPVKNWTDVVRLAGNFQQCRPRFCIR